MFYTLNILQFYLVNCTSTKKLINKRRTYLRFKKEANWGKKQTKQIPEIAVTTFKISMALSVMCAITHQPRLSVHYTVSSSSSSRVVAIQDWVLVST